MQMNVPLLYPRELSSEQVWAGEQGPWRPTCMHSHLHREKELMKWPCSAISASPNIGATNEPLRRGGMGKRRLGSFLHPLFPWEKGSFCHFSFWN